MANRLMGNEAMPCILHYPATIGCFSVSRVSHPAPHPDIRSQLNRCIDALNLFRRVIREQRWHRLSDAEKGLGCSMDGLRQILELHGLPSPESEEGIILRRLEIDVRRAQRLLARQMQDIDENIAVLDKGLAKLRVAAAVHKEK